MKKVLLLLFIILLSLAGVVAWGYRDLQQPLSHSKASEYIEIPKGATPTEIVEKLYSTGIIRRTWPLLIYIKATGAGPRLKAGEYRFPTPISALTVLRKLQEGEQRLERFTVIEGWTRWEIASSLSRIPELKLPSTEAAMKLLDDTSLIQDLDPTAKNLEGYLYPDTYSFPPNTTAKEMIQAMVQRFRKLWEQKFADLAKQKNTSVRETITIASLIETEAKLKDERPLVSSVIYNRLKMNIPLGIDSTVIYASRLAGKWKNNGKVYQSDLDRVSPYNTRKVQGLPPGPVASPGALSIEAALKPANTKYLYYVRNPNNYEGAHNFYENEKDFWRGVQELRNWEKARDQKALASPSP
jgi:UPF0755 protein